VELVGYLSDAQSGGSQQECCFHQQHLIDIVDDGTPRDLTNHAGKIDGRDVGLVGIKDDVMMILCNLFIISISLLVWVAPTKVQHIFHTAQHKTKKMSNDQKGKS